jgi:CubicO group peptidase (beta-lactamase class C family)
MPMKLFLLIFSLYSSLIYSSEFYDYAYNSQLGQTDVLIGIKNNKIVYEDYRNGFNYYIPHKLHSLSKLFISLFIAREEYLNRLNSRASVFPNASNNFEKKITIESLLRMSSGLRTVFDQEAMYRIKFSLIRPIESETDDLIDNYLKKSLPMFTPNSSFNYSFYDNNLLMMILDSRYPDFQKNMTDFINKELNIKATTFSYTLNPQLFFSGENSQFNKILRMYNPEQAFKIHPSLQFAFSSPEDLINVAKIFLNNGILNGKRVISEDWVKRSFDYDPKSFDSSIKSKSYFSKFTYGMYWFLNKPFSDGKKPYPNLPEDLVLFQGLRGQTLAIFPTQKAIYLRLGNDPLNSRFDREKHLNMFFNQFLK